jgi:succinate-acetate transporter protein
MFFGGICQYLSGIMEFIAGNTFGATVFPSYGAFNFSYAMIYIPGSGILASYTDSSTGQLNEQFPQALAIYIWAWFTLTVIYTIAAMRSSWILFLDLFFLDIDLLLLACGYMLNNPTLLKAGNSVGFVVAFLSCKHPEDGCRGRMLILITTDWAGCAGLWAGGITPINLPTFPMYKEKE